MISKDTHNGRKAGLINDVYGHIVGEGKDRKGKELGDVPKEEAVAVVRPNRADKIVEITAEINCLMRISQCRRIFSHD